MNVSLDVSHVKQRRRNLYHTNCKLNFSEEERAIIQTRALFDHKMSFDKGYVDYPPSADPVVDPAYMKIASRLLLLCGIPFIPFSDFWTMMCWLSSFGIFVYRKRLEWIENNSRRNSVIIADILRKGSFNVCAFNDPVSSKLLEHEIREELEGIKALISFSGKPIELHWFEL